MGYSSFVLNPDLRSARKHLEIYHRHSETRDKFGSKTKEVQNATLRGPREFNRGRLNRACKVTRGNQSIPTVSRVSRGYKFLREKRLGYQQSASSRINPEENAKFLRGER